MERKEKREDKKEIKINMEDKKEIEINMEEENKSEERRSSEEEKDFPIRELIKLGKCGGETGRSSSRRLHAYYPPEEEKTEPNEEEKKEDPEIAYDDSNLKRSCRSNASCDHSIHSQNSHHHTNRTLINLPLNAQWVSATHIPPQVYLFLYSIIFI